jgi:hypothetical protein
MTQTTHISLRFLTLLLGSYTSERLEKELHSLLPPYMSNGIRVIPPPHGADTAWFGAKLIGSVSYPLNS